MLRGAIIVPAIELFEESSSQFVLQNLYRELR